MRLNYYPMYAGINQNYLQNAYVVNKTCNVNPTSNNQTHQFVKEVLMNNYAWRKDYNPEKNSVIAYNVIATDFPAYNIAADGSVNSSGGYIFNPKSVEIFSKNETIAKYVQMKKLEYELLNLV